MRTQVSILTTFLLATVCVLATMGCSEEPTLVCGGDRELVDGVCLATGTDVTPPEPTASPGGGRYFAPVDVEIHAGEEATIYYTVGGDEPTTGSASGTSPVLVEDVSGDLRFFAIDSAGNRQPFVSSESYDIDEVGPAMKEVTVHPPDVTGSVLVSWDVNKPEDYDGVLVVRDKSDPPSFVPRRGTTYTDGERVGDLALVLHAGKDASALDDEPAGGASFYHAWGRDDLGNYSLMPMTASHDGPLEDNEATLIVSQTQRTVTLSEAPFDFGLTVTGTFEATGAIRIGLDVENRVEWPLSNIKVYAVEVGNGIAVADLQLDGFAAVHLGSEPMVTGASGQAEMTLVGHNPFPDPFLVRLRLRADPTLIVPGEHFSGRGGGHVVDAGAPSLTQLIDCEPMAFPASLGSGRCALDSWTWAPDHSVVYAGSRNTPWIGVIDPSTWTTTIGVELAQHGNTAALRMTPDDNHLVALVVTGSHRRGRVIETPTLELVTLERDSLVEVGRAVLDTGGANPRAGNVALTPDGQRALVVAREVNTLFVVELADMSWQAIPLPSSPLAVASDIEGATAFVGYHATALVSRVDLSTHALEALPLASARTSSFLVEENRLIAASKRTGTGIHILDLTTGETEVIADGESITALSYSADGRFVEALSSDFFRVLRLDRASLAIVGEVTLPGFARGHTITTTR